MSVSFSVKNIPEAVAERLRVRAERNHRSLQGELMAILEAAAHELSPVRALPDEKQPKRSVEDSLQRLRTLFTTLGQGANSADSATSTTALIRQMRDERYGDAWAAGGKQNGAAD